MKTLIKTLPKTELLTAFGVDIRMIRGTLFRVLGLLALLASSGAQAATIHKWVDAKGVTHYSDELPAATEVSVTQLEIDTRSNRNEASQAAGSARPDDYYSIANQWQRMNQERQQRQQLELQRAALSVERSASVETRADDDSARDTRYVVAYPRRYHKRHHRPHHKRPSHSGGAQLPANHSAGAFPSIVKP